MGLRVASMPKKGKKAPAWVNTLLKDVQKQTTQQGRQQCLDDYFEPQQAHNPTLVKEDGQWLWPPWSNKGMTVLYAKFNELPQLGATAQVSAGSQEEQASPTARVSADSQGQSASLPFGQYDGPGRVEHMVRRIETAMQSEKPQHMKQPTGNGGAAGGAAANDSMDLDGLLPLPAAGDMSMVDLFTEDDEYNAAVKLPAWWRSKAAETKYKAAVKLQAWWRSKAAETKYKASRKEAAEAKAAAEAAKAKAAAEAAKAEAAKAEAAKAEAAKAVAAKAAKAKAAQGKAPATGAAASGLGKRKWTMARYASVGVGHVADKGLFSPSTLRKTWPAKGGGVVKAKKDPNPADLAAKAATKKYGRYAPKKSSRCTWSRTSHNRRGLCRAATVHFQSRQD